jgi:alpha-glucosidase
VNFSDAELPLPDHARVLLASGPMAAAGMLPADTAVWLVEGVA